MASSVLDRLSDVHPKMLKVRGEGDRKALADHRRVVGRIVERALELMGITKQQAAFELGYTDQSTISRWCAAIERPHIDKLLALEGFADALLLAMAEQNPRIEVTTTIKLRRIA